MRDVLRIGTRGSALALWQARTVAQALEAGSTRADLVIIRTAGDRLQEAPLAEVGGKRLFVKEIEDALLREEIDVAVHSAKDMPAILPDGLWLAATLPRADARDALVLPSGGRPGDRATVLSQLGPAPRVGTSSVRRAAQLAAHLAGASCVPVRGNVDTRLRKLDEGGYDLLVLAAAGLDRLGLSARLSAVLPPEVCVPAPGQGIIAIETRRDDERARAAAARLHDPDAADALAAEQAVVAALGGGCQLPLGAHAVLEDGRLRLQAIVCAPDGGRIFRASAAGSRQAAAALGADVAAALAAQGATAVLDALRPAPGPVEGSY